MTDHIETGVDQVFDGIDTIIENGKYREAQEAAGVLAEMDFFRNYGFETVEFRYQELRTKLESMLDENDWPDVWQEE